MMNGKKVCDRRHEPIVRYDSEVIPAKKNAEVNQQQKWNVKN
jgi:hypothetical protein